jgi:hypothetical protein
VPPIELNALVQNVGKIENATVARLELSFLPFGRHHAIVTSDRSLEGM